MLFLGSNHFLKIQELKENSEKQTTKESAWTWLNVWTSWAEIKTFETNLLADQAKQLDENDLFVIFGVNATRDISKLSQISLVTFMLHIL